MLASAGVTERRERFVELNHVLRDGMVTFPGLPAPEIGRHLDREASRSHYAPGTEFSIDRLTLVGNTATYLDSPFHRYAEGGDLTTVPLDRVVDVPALVVPLAGTPRAIDADTFAGLDVRDRAVLLHTGDDASFGAPAYAHGSHVLTRAGADRLVEQGAALVGIDAVNIDDTEDPERPAHSILLAAGMPLVEHLTNLHRLPPEGATFTAVPLRIESFGTFPVRAFARLP